MSSVFCVSILARPRGRALHKKTGASGPEIPFQSSRALADARYGSLPKTTSVDTWFQSSRALADARYGTFSG